MAYTFVLLYADMDALSELAVTIIFIRPAFVDLSGAHSTGEPRRAST
jgi:hypothetical protein